MNWLIYNKKDDKHGLSLFLNLDEREQTKWVHFRFHNLLILGTTVVDEVGCLRGVESKEELVVYNHDKAFEIKKCDTIFIFQLEKQEMPD